MLGEYRREFQHFNKMMENNKLKKGKKTRISKFRTQRSVKLPPPVEVKIHRGEETSLGKITSDGVLMSPQHDGKQRKNVTNENQVKNIPQSISQNTKK